MRINSVVAARAGRFVRASLRDGTSVYTNIWKHLYLPDSITRIKERYGFIGVPTSIFELEVSDTQGLRFQHGKFVQDSRPVLIKSLEIYNNWVIATTESSTQDSDAFLSDMLAWLSGTDFTVVTYSYVAYFSQLEVMLEASFGSAVSFLSSSMTKLGTLLSAYNNIGSIDIKMSGFSLNYDTTKRPDANWGGFTIERRTGHSYDENVYFTQAPLQTNDHIALLTEIENALKETKS